LPHATGAKGENRKWPQTARTDILKQLEEDLLAKHDPSDGEGNARLTSGSEGEAGRPGRWTIEYEAGSLGVAVGGSVQLQVSPFWGWSPPQTDDPARPGYTRVSTDAVETNLSFDYCGDGCLSVSIGSQALRPGEHLTFTYGAGRAGAVADRYAEHGEHFYIWVDGDGDGTRRLLASNPTIDVKAGPPTGIVATLPSTAQLGDPVPLTMAFLDVRANAAPAFLGDVVIKSPKGLEFPAKVEFTVRDAGKRVVMGTAVKTGVYRVEVEAKGGLTWTSNPTEVTRGKPRRIRWADLQGHSNISDGSGSLDDYYSYARDVAALDIAAVTDHDHWGLGFLDQKPQWWKAVQQVADNYYQPGRFVTLPGYEWTSWIYGHRHVLYFSPGARLFSSLDPRTDTPKELWRALRATGAEVITVPHHPAGGPVAIDWSIPPDPLLEPVVEIVSVHGSSECRGVQGEIYHPRAGHFACDALAKGYHLGMIGSGDGHDGHPGLSHLAAPSGGLAAIITDDLTREGVVAALRARRVYATNGQRIILEFHLGVHPMGSVTSAERGDSNEAYFGRIIGTAPIKRLELVKKGSVARAVSGNGKLVASLSYRDKDRKPGDYVYLRAVQVDGAMAWSSPIWTK